MQNKPCLVFRKEKDLSDSPNIYATQMYLSITYKYVCVVDNGHDTYFSEKTMN